MNEPEGIMLIVTSQIVKDKCCMVSLASGS